ncbi:MAG: tetratricopeptide repeat protein, partial [Flavisolibacter sp.]
MPQQRQLAAVMFTDIEGYSAIMQYDEQQAIALRNRHREIIEKEHKRFEGRIVQYYGDGTLSVFQSAVFAVECALAMQLSFRKEPMVPVRIGIHIGDIVLDDTAVFGDGVNLASRIESLSVPGSVLMSDKVNDEINNHTYLKTVSVGSYQFKNIKRKVEVFALDHDALVQPPAGTLKGKLDEKNIPQGIPIASVSAKSIAVLPFVNMSNDPEQEYFSNGMAEEILNSLASLDELKVAGRSSSFQYNTKSTSLREIGEKLGVSTVLEGSVRKQGGRLRVTVQLLNVEDGFHLWSQRYDRNAEDVFAIQDEVALAVMEKLKVTLLEKDRRRMGKSHTQNSEAYELYLKGRFHINKRGASIMTGIHCFQLAIDLDPNFALAHTGFGDAILMAAFYGFLRPSEVVHKAKDAAIKAMEIDPDLCEPYCTLGCYYTCFDWNWKEAEKYFSKSLDINPKYTQAHYWYGNLYLAWVRGDIFRAVTHGRIAIELEPQSPLVHSLYGAILHTAGKYEEALVACQAALELDPEAFLGRLYLGWCYLSLRKYEQAVKTFEQLEAASKGHHFAKNALAVAYAITWKFNKAREIIKQLKETAVNEYVAHTVTALAAAYLDDLDEAFRLLDKAYSDRDPLIIAIK